MSTTTTTTTTSQSETARDQPPRVIKVLSRVASIPMISSSLTTIDDTLVANPYIRQPYCTAKGLSTTAYNYTVSVQVLAPLIGMADTFANKAVDVVQSRYPYPFTAKPEEVAQYVRERRQSAVTMANKNFDEKVMSPVVHVAQGIDQSFTPIVNAFEGAVTRFNHTQPAPETKYQYQRAYELSKNFKYSLYEYSNEQFNQLQEHNQLVRKATETANSISALASSSLMLAQKRVHDLSDKMVQELQKVQHSSANLSSLLASSLHSASATQQEAFNEISATLSTTISDLRSILGQQIPLNEKVSRVGAEINNKVRPVLDKITKKVSEAFGAVRSRAENTKENGINGHADGGPMKR